MDLKLVKKKRFEAEKRWGFTNYRIGITTEIKGIYGFDISKEI